MATKQVAVKLCQYTGLPLDNPRAKNHPAVARLLDRANRDGVYRAVVDALTEAGDAGMTGQAVIDAGQAAYVAATETAEQRRQRAEAEAYAAEQRRRAQRQRRDAINGALRAAGYTWHHEDEESMDRFGASAFEAEFGAGASDAWVLTAPDGARVSINDALRAIGRADLIEAGQ